MQRGKACMEQRIDSRFNYSWDGFIEKRNCTNFKRERERERVKKGRRINYTFFPFERQSLRVFIRRLPKSKERSGSRGW